MATATCVVTIDMKYVFVYLFGNGNFERKQKKFRYFCRVHVARSFFSSHLFIHLFSLARATPFAITISHSCVVVRFSFFVGFVSYTRKKEAGKTWTHRSHDICIYYVGYNNNLIIRADLISKWKTEKAIQNKLCFCFHCALRLDCVRKRLRKNAKIEPANSEFS